MPVTHSDSVSNQYLNVSGYRFTTLNNLDTLQPDMLTALKEAGCMGTILIAEEGINVALSATPEAIAKARAYFESDERLAGLWLKESWSEIQSFTKMKVRIRPEIITFDGGKTRGAEGYEKAPAITPETLKMWLDEGRDFVLLDTRNDYEIRSGTFSNAIDIDLVNFRDFPTIAKKAIESGQLPTDKPVVTFCTGGIRCEKAAPYLADAGLKEVYQIEGGILNWFEQYGNEHWDGDCFVFDDRHVITPQLAETNAWLCRKCNSARPEGQESCPCQSGSSSAADTV